MILITRPKKETAELAQILKKKKLKTFQEPLIYFKYLKKKIINKEDKIFIVASVHSINAINIKINQKNIKQASFVVIGDNTAKEIKKIGVKNILLVADNGNQLLTKIKQRKKYISKEFEFLCSNIYNKDFVSSLKIVGLKVKLNFVYRTYPKKTMSNNLVRAVKLNKIKIAIFYSEFTLSVFLTLAKKHGFSKQMLFQIQFLCLSKRIGSKLTKKNLDVYWPSKPNQKAMLSLLSAIY